jgi:transposase
MKFWEISDSFWEAVKPLIPPSVREPGKVYQRIAGGGRKPLDPRKVFSAIVYVLKTGAQWKSLPKEFYGSPSSIHAYFKKWEEQGLFTELWKKGLAEFEEMKGIAWEWTLDTTRNAKAAMERAKNSAASENSADTSQNGEQSSADNLIWRPVISRRSREQAKALCDKAAALFTDTFKS